MKKYASLSPGFKKIQRPRSLTDIAYQGIKENIIEGRLLAGQIYSELEIARKMGISKTPVREALIRLSADHLIVFHPRKGISVNYFNRQDIENLFEMREIIECAAVAKLRHLSAAQVAALQHLIARQERDLQDSGGQSFFDFDREFHLFFIEAAGNRFMVRMNNDLRNYIAISSQSALVKEGRATEVLLEHKSIVKALAAGDSGGAIAAVKIHLDNSKVAALESFEYNLDHMKKGEV
jgi:DNA-binding GntR family transcriptional regulator